MRMTLTIHIYRLVMFVAITSYSTEMTEHVTARETDGEVNRIPLYNDAEHTDLHTTEGEDEIDDDKHIRPLDRRMNELYESIKGNPNVEKRFKRFYTTNEQVMDRYGKAKNRKTQSRMAVLEEARRKRLEKQK